MTFITFAAADAFGARPFVTDDARVVDPDGSQIETFVKRQRRFSEQEFWLLPAHNFAALAGGRVELTLGGTWLDSAPLGDARSVIVQAKTLLKPLETNGAGFAMTLGAQRLAPSGAGSPQTNPYVNGIGSFSFAGDAIVVHTNLGVRHDAGAGAGTARATWGAGSEIRLHERVFGILEAYGERGEKPTRHGGLRVWLVPGRVQADSTVGFQNGAPERRFHTVGLRVLW